MTEVSEWNRKEISEINRWSVLKSVSFYSLAVVWTSSFTRVQLHFRRKLKFYGVAEIAVFRVKVCNHWAEITVKKWFLEDILTCKKCNVQENTTSNIVKCT